jgi:3',5'-cyclic AMP phosphodiesterase CpdA
MSDVCILHLTDIHAGPGGTRDIDAKTPVPGVKVQAPLERLTLYLQALPRRPDFVVVSGDLTIRGGSAGFQEVRKWLLTEITRATLPPAERILLVPGNHDVRRRTRSGDDDRRRFEDFWQTFGLTFPHASIPGLDPETVLPTILSGGPSLIGGIRTKQEHGEIKLTSTLPFLLDLDSDVLIYGFNSAHGCGIPLDPKAAILDPIKAVASVSDGNAADLLKKAEEAYLDSLVIDAGMITTEQIASFNEHMANLKKQLGGKFDKLTKVAVLHHHIGHLWRQQLELKVFEAVIDAPQLKQALTEHSFDLVLHGHKHTNHVGLDGSLIPIDQRGRFNPLCVIAGGAVGGDPRQGDKQSFKLIELLGSAGPRRGAVIHEIPLRPANVPAAVIAHEARIYNVSLADRFPHLHDFAAVKDGFDIDLVARLAPELDDAAGLHFGNATIAEGGRKLFSSIHRYRCYACVDTENCRMFYEVVQATKALKFGTIARIHWLITELLGRHVAKPTRIVLLLGNLEETHYSEGEQSGETLASIDKLKEWLEPARSAGLVEVRSHAYTQNEAATITLSKVA